MKKLLTIVLSGVLVACLASSALAWEFSMNGEYEWRYRYYSKTGPNDLFGRSGPSFDIGFAGPNIYGHGGVANVTPQAVVAPTATSAGVAIVRGGYSFTGPDASYYDSRLTLHPVIRVNPAVRVQSVLTIGGYRNKFSQYNNAASIGTPPFERYYMHQTSDGAYDTASIISVEQFRSTLQLPWGVISIGNKDFPFGTGAVLSQGVRSDDLLVVVPYGPFRFMVGLWLARNALNGAWGTNPDSDLKPQSFGGLVMTYDSSDMSLGGIWVTQQTHVKRLYAATPSIGVPANGGMVNGYDSNLSFWLWFMKYNNGRFFANAEYAWFNQDIYRIGPNETAPSIFVALPTNAEGNMFFAETGFMAGPAKLTFMYGRSSGPVLNNPNPTKSYQSIPIAYQATDPYNWLMFSTYGGGNQTFGGLFQCEDGHGAMADAFCYAARLDYAVASNLNLWASYMWAHRLEKFGSNFGGVNSAGATAAAGSADQIAFAANAGRAATTRFVGGGSGATTTYGWVSDGFIGWEANVGVDWKILEGVTWQNRYAYWQPGDFFKEAWQARLPNSAGTAADNQVLSSRDAIQAVNTSLLINF